MTKMLIFHNNMHYILFELFDSKLFDQITIRFGFASNLKFAIRPSLIYSIAMCSKGVRKGSEVEEEWYEGQEWEEEGSMLSSHVVAWRDAEKTMYSIALYSKWERKGSEGEGKEEGRE